MVPVVGAAFLEGVEVGFVGLRPVGPARLAVAAHAVALDVAQVLGERLRAGPLLIDQQRLDGHAPRHGRQLRAGEARRRVAAPQREPGRWPVPAAPPAGRRTADLPLLALPACLSTLETKLWPWPLPRFFGAGAHAEIVVAAVGHGCAPCKLRRVRSCEARGHACIGAGLAPHAARRRSRSVPRHPHVQTGFRRGPVPRPFVLPSAFAPRWRSGQRRPGGAAARAASAPANAPMAAGRARSRQDACTLDGCAGGSAKCGANAPALHARRHGDEQQNDTPDGTMRCTATCSESAAIMGVTPARPDAQRRSRRMR
jgi:hypothetical protein